MVISVAGLALDFLRLSSSKFLEVARPGRFSKLLFRAKTVHHQNNFGNDVTLPNLSGLKIGPTEATYQKRNKVPDQLVAEQAFVGCLWRIQYRFREKVLICFSFIHLTLSKVNVTF